MTTRMNGVGSFVPSVNKLVFQYNNASRSSQLLMLYIQSILPTFAAAHAHIEVAVVSSPRSDALISAQYGNGKVKNTDVSRMSMKGLIRAVEELANQNGNEPKRLQGPVQSYSIDPLSKCNPFYSEDLFRP